MPYLKIYNQYITTAANANPQTFILEPPDTNQTYRVKAWYVGYTTAGTQFELRYGGKTYASVDASRFAAGEQEVKTDVVVSPGNDLKLVITTLAGTAHAALPVMIEYETDQP